MGEDIVIKEERCEEEGWKRRSNSEEKGKGSVFGVHYSTQTER